MLPPPASKPLACGCLPGEHRCPTAERIWAEKEASRDEEARFEDQGLRGHADAQARETRRLWDVYLAHLGLED